jgi:hypothetical protein
MYRITYVTCYSMFNFYLLVGNSCIRFFVIFMFIYSTYLFQNLTMNLYEKNANFSPIRRGDVKF